MIMEWQFQPVIIFSFSRRECEHHAMSMAKLDFNTQEEKDAIDEVFRSAILCLSEEDRNLPAIEQVLPTLQRGIAVHHSGLLPIIKELVELLFQEGLVKALFATETLAMGLNMPAKTAVFTSVKKWDGDTNRYIGSGEYIQPGRVTGFCKRNKLQLIIKAHECVMDGFERFAHGLLITLFSATNYCGTANHAGAILVVGRGLVIVPKLIQPLPSPVQSPETSPERTLDDTGCRNLTFGGHRLQPEVSLSLQGI